MWPWHGIRIVTYLRMFPQHYFAPGSSKHNTSGIGRGNRRVTNIWIKPCFVWCMMAMSLHCKECPDECPPPPPTPTSQKKRLHFYPSDGPWCWGSRGGYIRHQCGKKWRAKIGKYKPLYSLRIYFSAHAILSRTSRLLLFEPSFVLD